MARVKVRNDARLRKEMKASGIDVLIAFSMENVLYLSGALFSLQDYLRERLAAAGFVRDGRDFLVAATNEMSVAEAQSHVGERRGYVEFRGTALTVLAELLGDWDLAGATIGIEKRYLAAEFYEDLQGRLPKARFVAGDRVLEIARAIKTPAHLDAIRRANCLTEDALERTFSEIHVGDTEKAAATQLIANMYALGCDVMRHCVFTVGDNARHAHPSPSPDKILEQGDVIRVDVGGLFDGQGSDIARMAIVGEPSSEQRRHYETLRTAQRTIAAELTPGVTAGDVFAKAVEIYAGLGITYRRDHIGHSLSILGAHDEPLFHPGNPTVLEENMAIALEPILPDKDGRRYTVEDIFRVAPGEGELLTTRMDTSQMFRVW